MKYFSVLLLFFTFQSNAQNALDGASCEGNPTTRVVGEFPALNDESSLKTVRICNVGTALRVESPDGEVALRHLVAAGVYGIAPTIGFNLTYAQMDSEDWVRFHVDLTQGTNLQAYATGVTLGIHPIKHEDSVFDSRILNSFYYGATAMYMYTGSGEQAPLFGPQVGFSGGRGVITGHLDFGVLGGNDNRAGWIATPIVSGGLRIGFRFRTGH